MIDLPKAVFDTLAMPWVKAVNSIIGEHDDRLGAVEQSAGNANTSASNLKTWVGNLISGQQQATAINVANNIVNLTGRTHSVSSGVAAVFGADGTLGISTSAERFKQDITPKIYTLDQIASLQIITYRLISDVNENGDRALVQSGVIAEQLIEAGFPEFVLWDGDQPLTVDYARMVTIALSGVQELAAAYTALDARISKLEAA